MPRVDNEMFYKSAIEVHGTTAKGVNWASKKNQELRFEILLKMLPNDLNNFTIVDAGCGFGDFYSYLEKNKKLPKEYVGIDSLSDMCAIASNKTGCNIIQKDICKDELEAADYYVCSGAMNTLERFETYLFMRNCFEASRYGFVFNILHGKKESETYNYFTRAQIQKIAKELGVSRVIFRENYLEADITALFLKGEE